MKYGRVISKMQALEWKVLRAPLPLIRLCSHSNFERSFKNIQSCMFHTNLHSIETCFRYKTVLVEIDFSSALKLNICAHNKGTSWPLNREMTISFYGRKWRKKRVTHDRHGNAENDITDLTLHGNIQRYPCVALFPNTALIYCTTHDR